MLPDHGTSHPNVLRKLLATTQLERMPKHPRRRDILLALLALSLKRRYPYTELELNDTLKDSLASYATKVDHVTCRRYMVDLGFLRRDRAGTRYFLNFPKLEETLAEEVFEQAPALVQRVLAEQRAEARERAERRRQHNL